MYHLITRTIQNSAYEVPLGKTPIVVGVGLERRVREQEVMDAV